MSGKLDNAESFKRLRNALPASVSFHPPLKFRTAGFPQYGFKREFRRDLREQSLIRGQSRHRLTRRHGPCGQAPCGVTRRLVEAIPSRGPWLANRLCCPARSSLTMASSEPLESVRRLICFVRRTPQKRVGPQFKFRVCLYMPSPVPRWIGQVQLTVASLTTLVFIFSTEIRHPQAHAVGSRVDA
jgi:hypothetical protein